MSGIDLRALARDNPTIALAKSQVEFIRSVAKFLREMRVNRGLSQARMAKLLGVSQPRIAQIESGKPGDAASLEQIAGYAYCCDISLIPASMAHFNKGVALGGEPTVVHEDLVSRFGAAAELAEGVLNFV
jgi:transcriptional regulator with XRE-family HTH domain